MQTRKIAYAVMGALMITSVLAGCGKRRRIQQLLVMKETHRLARRRKVVLRVKKSQLVRVMILLESQIAILLDIKHNYQKGYTKIGNAGEIIFNEKDKADLYISRILETKKKLPLSDLTEEKDI